jgi:hypothetical protein
VSKTGAVGCESGDGGRVGTVDVEEFKVEGGFDGEGLASSLDVVALETVLAKWAFFSPVLVPSPIPRPMVEEFGGLSRSALMEVVGDDSVDTETDNCCFFSFCDFFEDNNLGKKLARGERGFAGDGEGLWPR